MLSEQRALLTEDSNYSQPWLFYFTGIPFGVCFGVIGSALPYLLTQSTSLPAHTVALIPSLATLPAALYFLWAPLVDIFPYRRRWFVGASVVSAAMVCLSLALSLGVQHANFAIIFLCCFATAAATTFTSVASAGLAATTSDPQMRSRVAGWKQAGTSTGLAIGGGLILYLEPAWLIWTVPGIVLLPCFAIFGIKESITVSPRNERALWFRNFFQTFISSRRFRFFLLVLVLPIGTAAASSLFSTIAKDYNAPTSVVVWVAGIGAVVFTSLGAVFAGYAFTRVTPLNAYIFSGILVGVVSLCLWIAPVTPSSYVIGNSIYLLLMGCCNAAFTNVALSVASEFQQVAGTSFSLLAAINNLSAILAITVEGQSLRFGPRGVYGTDAILITIGLIVFLLLRKIYHSEFIAKPGK